ncbi:MAG: ATP-dependent 6-phosphofructokinase [Thermoplasmata archaeon]|uniref:ATP-dependent 6-phosphofructokinase n=1 Tax=Candidatus Sysuiplasma superficiale TaxID=2823368 RepID=A0A8J7YXK9_9ARCH|nr:ATP-dependent 6-phosphofructokinase [Candidatus Sysuiplasma superficiale]MBX8644749.1 ATP-dependent 6-phosphofructokinase [Candidatus Sysuiplasma superficiale]
MKIGVLNGGGDCAGLNAVTRGILAGAAHLGVEVIGIRNGWAGLLENRTVRIDYNMFEELIGTGGTALGTSRTNPLKRKDGLQTVVNNMTLLGLDCLIAVGGDDTLGVAAELWRNGQKIIGVPKTIDNDLAGTDYSFGFFSAVDEAMRMIESLKTTGKSHGRVMVAEVMGRDAGWISAFAGIAAGANAVIIPEFQSDPDEVVRIVRERHNEGKSSTVVVAEGVKFVSREKAERDEFGHELIAKAQGETNASWLARYIEEKTGLETRATVLGHTIRGTAPNSYDRVMTSLLGLKAIEAAHEGRYGIMVSIRGTKIEEVPLSEGVQKKYVDPATWNEMKKFFM